MSNVNVVIVGFGGMGKQHFRMIKTVEGIEVIGMRDLKPEREDEGRDFGITVYKDLDAVLNDPKVDIVLVATPNDVHKEIVLAALNAGKNVICEKPITMSSADYADMVACAKKNGKLLAAHQNRRWDEDFRMIKRLYDEKTIGEFFNVESRVMGSRGIPGDWRKVKKQGGGMMLDWGVHLLDQILWMKKEPVVNVYAEYSFINGEEVEDGFKLLLTFEDGMRAHIEVDTNHFISLPRWAAFGTNGSATIGGWECDGTATIPTLDEGDSLPIRAGSGVTKTMAPRSDAHLDVRKLERMPKESDCTDYYRNFAAAIKGEAEIIVKHDEVMRVLKVMEAAYDSAMRGAAIKVSL